jgi:hypothetical protein
LNFKESKWEGQVVPSAYALKEPSELAGIQVNQVIVDYRNHANASAKKRTKNQNLMELTLA